MIILSVYNEHVLCTFVVAGLYRGKKSVIVGTTEEIEIFARRSWRFCDSTSVGIEQNPLIFTHTTASQQRVSKPFIVPTLVMIDKNGTR